MINSVMHEYDKRRLIVRGNSPLNEVCISSFFVDSFIHYYFLSRGCP